MAEKRFKAEQIVVMLREAEIQMAKGLDLAQACRNIGISDTRGPSNMFSSLLRTGTTYRGRSLLAFLYRRLCG